MPHSQQWPPLTFQASGIELNEELGAAGCLHNGFNALKLNVGLV